MAKIEVRKVVSVTVAGSRPYSNPKSACMAWAKEVARRRHYHQFAAANQAYMAKMNLATPAADRVRARDVHELSVAQINKLRSATISKAYRRAKPIFDKLFQN